MHIRGPRIFAHRGGAGLWPENSLTAFHRVAALQVHGVEFDVHMTRDGEVVVIHDPVLDRMTDAVGPVGERTLAELREVRLRDAVESVPTLDEVLSFLAETELGLRLEIKTGTHGRRYVGLEDKVLHALNRFDLLARTTIIAFDWQVLAAVRNLSPRAAVGGNLDLKGLVRMRGWQRVLARLRAHGIGELSADHHLFRPVSTEKFLREGVRVSVWTVNKEKDLARWLKSTVDSVTTDRPDLALRVRRQGTAT
jgi:glycerophosphoryl diester phosphodiesterase